MTIQRQLSFTFAVISGLFCGTNYVFSSWGPQMSVRCHLTALAINMVGISGNLGVYLTSPLSGKLVDKTGQRIPLLLSSAALFFGYYGLYRTYRSGSEHASGSVYLCFCSFLTGVGSSLGNAAALNACAKSYPKHRGTATAFPIAAYGLSAFLFSRISYLIFPGDTENFLLTLAISCGATLFISSFFIGVHHKARTSQDELLRKASNSRSSSEVNSLLSQYRIDSSASSAMDDDLEIITEITGVMLFRNADFLFMVSTIALLSGSGLMYINNLGNNITALFRFEHLVHSLQSSPLEKLQALNVSVLSVLNCTGRIFAGLVSDQLKSRYGIQRSTFLTFSSLLFMLGLYGVYGTSESFLLVKYTSVIGFAYGCMFGIAPVLCSELFGLQNFSANWGLMSVFPGISGNIYNLAYGHIYDQHSDPVTHECAKGVACYQAAFAYATIGAGIAAISSTLLVWRHVREHRARLAIADDED